MGFIYIWENKLDGKKYLGKCQGDPSSSYVGSGKHFKRAVKKYGLENFERTIIEHCNSPTELIIREQYWLDYYQAATNPIFYNISPNSGGGHHGADYKGEKHPMWGKKHPNHKPHIGKENGMYGVRRHGAKNPNAKAVIIVDDKNNVYEGNCLKEVCNKIFGNTDYYERIKHLVSLCMRGSKPRRDSMFYGWTGKYKEIE
jgi:hypothetical protein